LACMHPRAGRRNARLVDKLRPGVNFERVFRHPEARPFQNLRGIYGANPCTKTAPLYRHYCAKPPLTVRPARANLGLSDGNTARWILRSPPKYNEFKTNHSAALADESCVRGARDGGPRDRGRACRLGDGTRGALAGVGFAAGGCVAPPNLIRRTGASGDFGGFVGEFG